MTFNYRQGLFRIWLVLSLLWVAVAVRAGLSVDSVIGVPLVFGAVLYLVVWAIRSFAVKPSSEQTFDLRELRQNLAAIRTENPEFYETELAPIFNRLETKYGNNVPITQMDGLQGLVSSKLASIEEQKQAIINRGAAAGEAIEMERLLRFVEDSKAAYTGADREAYIMQMDKLFGAITAKYGSRIPVDHAYKIMQDLEAGRGFNPDE